MRLVFDTNIILKAFRSPTGGSADLVRAARNQKLVMLATPPLFFEYEQVVTRPEQMKAAGASTEDAHAFLDVLAAILTPVDVHYLWRPQLTDAEDEMVLEAAINGGADALVTFERTTFMAAARSFGVEVVTPAEILGRISK